MEIRKVAGRGDVRIKNCVCLAVGFFKGVVGCCIVGCDCYWRFWYFREGLFRMSLLRLSLELSKSNLQFVSDTKPLAPTLNRILLQHYFRTFVSCKFTLMQNTHYFTASNMNRKKEAQTNINAYRFTKYSSK